MIEVELKFQLQANETDALMEKLLNLGFSPAARTLQNDSYFDTNRDVIAKGDKALRLRTLNDLSNHLVSHQLTYKGGKADAISQTRQELEVEVSDSKTMSSIIHALGFTKVYEVKKIRNNFQNGNITASVDKVEQLGDFCELEILVDCIEEKAQAQQSLFTLYYALGFDSSRLQSKTYLELLMEHKSNS